MSAAPAYARMSRSERRIALIKPAVAAEDQAALAIKLLDSVLWVFKGTTQSNWTLCGAESAQVIVVHQDEPAQRIADWRKQGKLIVVINTVAAASSISPYTLLYPFPTVQVLRLLEQLDAELDFGATAGRASPSAPASTSDTRGGSRGSDAWGFVDSLRTLRMINNADTWFVGKDSSGPALWVRGDGSRYCCDSATAHAIRTGACNLSGLTLQKAAAAPPSELSLGAGSELAWFAGYHASKAIAPWMSERETYRLTRWPDFGRVQSDDSLLRAAQIRVLAVLDATPATAAQLSVRTNTSFEFIARTLNALASCELVEVAPMAAPNVASTKAASPVPAGRLRQFLRNMRKHLGLWTSP